MHEAKLCEADLRGVDLHWADLLGADLLGANLHGANLRGADLHWAKLQGADLRGANLRGADLREADLCGTRGYVDLGTDKRSYHFRAVAFPDGWHITAGCRNFTVKEAVKHWRATRNKDALARVAILKAHPLV